MRVRGVRARTDILENQRSNTGTNLEQQLKDQAKSKSRRKQKKQAGDDLYRIIKMIMKREYVVLIMKISSSSSLTHTIEHKQVQSRHRVLVLKERL